MYTSTMHSSAIEPTKTTMINSNLAPITVYPVHVEIEKHSNVKREFDKKKGEFVIDRILPYPYFFPFAYGYFQNTLGNDGDELDALILTNNCYRVDDLVNCRIVGGLLMEDEKGMDEKIFVVPEKDNMFEQLPDVEKESIYEDIFWFFSHYKSKSQSLGKWSKVHRLLTMDEALDVYGQSVKNFKM